MRESFDKPRGGRPFGLQQRSTGRRRAFRPRVAVRTALIEWLEARMVLAAPVALPDTYATNEEIPLTVAVPGVLANDSDADGDALDAVLQTNVSNGSLTFNADGSFQYVPNPGFTGNDSFTYKARNFAKTFAVDQSASTVNLSGDLTTTFGRDTDSDNSRLGGTIKAKVTPDNAPFSAIHLRDLDVQFIDAVDLHFGFGFIIEVAGLDVHADANSIFVEMLSPGPEVGVSGTSFTQPDNTLRLFGTANVDATGLADGQIPEGPTPFDTTNVQPLSGTIQQSVQTITLNVPIDIAQVIDDGGGNVLNIHITGTIVARATAGPLEESTATTVTIDVRSHIDPTYDVYRMSEDGQLVVSDPPNNVLEEVLVPTGSAWKYLDNGSDQGTAWRNVGFNDAAWLAGQAELGYGDGGETTVVGFGGNAANKYITTYFRRAVSLPHVNDIYELALDVKRDDGVSVYVNGVEVVRDNLPGTLGDNSIGFGTRALVAVADDGGSFFSFVAPASMLVEGTNVIAVEIHQAAPDSSDISFDLRLQARRADRSVLANDRDIEGHALAAELVSGPANGTLHFSADGTFDYAPNANFSGSDSFTYRAREQYLVAPGSRWKYLDNGSDQQVDWIFSFYNDQSWAEGPAQLGYGDGDEATLVGYGGDQINKHITTYFRRKFNVADPTSLGDLRLSVIRDDGVAVYLNGQRVGLDNLDPNATFQTLATASISGAAENAPIEFIVPNSRLVFGENTVAVEIHQAAIDSSDISFDLSLAPTGRPQSATATIVVEPVNDAPQADADGPYSTPNGTSLAVAAASGVLAGDSDAENAALRAVLVSPPANGTFNLNADGSFNWAPGAAGPASFTYRAAETSATTLVGFGSRWRVLDDGSNQGTAWRAAAFDDSAWWLGRGELGYGDGDETTLVRFFDTDGVAAGVQKNLTTYFRHSFQLADASRVLDLAGQMRVDDGAAVYLNGQRVTLHKLDADVAFNQPSNASGENDVATFTADPALLVNGTNVLSVEVHQTANTSSDVSFDLQLTGTLASANVTVPLSSAGATIVGRQVFYNRSFFDGGSAAADPADDAAIDTTKTALLPGQTASLSNYTAYTRGLNGIMIDLAGTHGAISAADFEFRVGNSQAVATWAPLASAVSVSTRGGAGAGGSDRITLVLGDNAVQKQWLQVRTLANVNTGLSAADVFYFGNAIGEIGNTANDFSVETGDELQIRGNPHNLASPVPVAFRFDVDKDRYVNVSDQLAARGNRTNLANRLAILTPPATSSPAAADLAEAALGAGDESLDPAARRLRWR